MEEHDKVATSNEGQPIRCKAAVSRKPGEALSIEEIIVAPPMPREASIHVTCSSICPADLTFWKVKEDPAAIWPRILGHEAIGVVESIGEGVTEVAKGDSVITVFLPDCGECIDCKSPKSNLCSKFPYKVSPWMPRYDGTSRFTDLNGDIIHHFLFISSFSEYTVVDIANLTKIDPAAPPSSACLLGCVSAGIGAPWRLANVAPGSTVAIFGLGTIGFAAAEGARHCGATRIIGVDVNPEKFETARKFGVTEFVHAGECGDKSVSQVILEITGGGVDYCFECVGSASLVQEAYASCRKGWGKTVVLGVDKPESMLSLNTREFLFNGKTLMASLFGGLKPKTHVPILYNATWTRN